MNKEIHLAIKLLSKNGIVANPDEIDAVDMCISALKDATIEDLLKGKEDIFRSIICGTSDNKVAIKIWVKTGCQEWQMEIIPMPEHYIDAFTNKEK